MVSFRLSQEEYARFRTICSAHGVRSLSDFTRTAMQELIVSGSYPDPLFYEVGDLRNRIQSLSREVDRISQALEARRLNKLG